MPLPPEVVAYAFYRVVSPVSHLLQSLMSLKPLDPRQIFPEIQSVDDWYLSLAQLGYIKPLRTFLPIRDKTVVTGLYFCKNNNRLRHEFIVANLHKPDGEDVHAIIERSGSDTRPELAELRAQREGERRMGSQVGMGDQESPSTSSLSSQTFIDAVNGCSEDMLDRIQKTSTAKDSVRFVPKTYTPPKQAVIKYYQFKEHRRPTLVDLATAAVVAHRYDKYYSLFRHQCYWYADCVCVVLETMVGEDNYIVHTRSAKLVWEDWVDIGEEKLSEVRSMSVATVAIEFDQLQWSKLEQGSYLVKIASRKPVVVCGLRTCLKQVKEEYQKMDEDRKMEEEENRQNRDGRETAEHKLEELERINIEMSRTIEDLQTQLGHGSQPGTSN